MDPNKTYEGRLTPGGKNKKLCISSDMFNGTLWCQPLEVVSGIAFIFLHLLHLEKISWLLPLGLIFCVVWWYPCYLKQLWCKYHFGEVQFILLPTLVFLCGFFCRHLVILIQHNSSCLHVPPKQPLFQHHFGKALSLCPAHSATQEVCKWF